jgi:hypothetical protein
MAGPYPTRILREDDTDRWPRVFPEGTYTRFAQDSTRSSYSRLREFIDDVAARRRLDRVELARLANILDDMARLLAVMDGTPPPVGDGVTMRDGKSL